MTPFVSIIIPVKNEEHLVERCLQAIENIDYPQERFEIIVVDNGSSDNTVNIVKNQGFTVYIKPDLTIAGLRNYGAQMAQGEVFAFLDADVIVTSEWLKCGVAALMEDGVGCAGCSPEIPDNASWVEKIWHMQIDVRPARYEKAWLESMNMFVWKQSFEEIGGFNEKLHTCEDVDFGYRLNKRWKIIYAKNIVAIHHGEAKSVLQLFKKESWRGLSNFEGIASHGLICKELPSHAITLYYCCALLTLPLLLILDYRTFCIIACTSLFPPGLISIVISKKSRTYGSLFPLMAIWTVYCFARGWSLLRNIRKTYDK